MKTNILVVDDDKSIRNLIKVYLENEGYDVVQASNGKEALSMINENNFDLVILDVMMPILDGISACMKIRENYTMPKIYSLIENNNVKILALGVSSPVVPSDVVCFFSTLTGMPFSKYALTTFIADTPVILLYTFLGISMKYSLYVFIATFTIIILVSYINYRRWNSRVN